MKLLAALVVTAPLVCGAWPTANAQDPSVLTFHGRADRDGDYVAPGLTVERAGHMHLDSKFSATIKGAVYAQPLYWHPEGSSTKLLIVATEENMVYALNAETGAQVWQRSLGKPAVQGTLPCGNIFPDGVTGTPAIDPKSKSVYIDAVVLDPSAGAQHLIFALSLADGSVMSGWPVNIASLLKAGGQTFNPPPQSSRSALLIQDDRLYLAYGGLWGDCGDYHGWVVSLPLHNPKDVHSWHTRARAGGIWGPSGIASDGKSLFVTTGNTMGADTFGDGEALIRLTPQVTTSEDKSDFFAPTDWKDLDDRDEDLGGLNPLVINLPKSSGGPSETVLALGKDGKAYLTDGTNLGGFGGALATEKVADGEIRGSATSWPTSNGAMVVFQNKGSNCPASAAGDGLVALAITAGAPPTIHTAWCADLHGGGSPIVTTSNGNGADPIVWVTGAEGDNRLHGYQGDNGKEIFAGGEASDAMEHLRHFVSVVVADHHLYVAGDNHLYAFTY